MKELHALEEYFHDECPLIYLHVQPNTYAMSNDHDFGARADERIRGPLHQEALLEPNARRR